MVNEKLSVDYQGIRRFYANYSYSKGAGVLKRECEVDGIVLKLELEIPFKINKLKDQLFDATSDIDTIIILRNRYFGERNLIKVKYPINNENKDVGFIFSLSTLLDEEGLGTTDRLVSMYGLRGLVSLLFNQTSLPANNITVDSRLDFNLLDYYPEDILICAISKEQLDNYSLDIETGILYHLNLYGFYYISDPNRDFIPRENILHQEAFESILDESGKGIILAKPLCEEISKEPYLNKYIRYINSQEADDLSRFLLSYQVFELLIDVVSKFEIKNKICSSNSKDKSGYDLKNDLLEISKESFRINKLFKHYSSYNFDSNFHACEKIEYFINKYFDENLSVKDYGGYFYAFRNKIVHNLRAIYTDDPLVTDSRKEELFEIVNKVEFLTTETLISFEYKD